MTLFIRLLFAVMTGSLTGLASVSQAGQADIVDATIKKTGERQYTISATVQHADTGWEHYANQFQVFDLQGKLLGTRVLHHPHVNEQPFTRSLSLAIPIGINEIRVIAGDSVHGDGGETMTIAVPD